MVACSQRTAPLRSLDPPPPADVYSTTARPNGLLGEGASEVADALEPLLVERGYHAEPDGALAAVAVVALRDAYAGKRPSTDGLSAAARRFGFAGNLQSMVVMNRDQGDLQQELRDMFNFPRNQVVTRYGIATFRGGRDVCVLLGSVEALLEDFPKTVSAGAAIRLQGEISTRFARALVVVKNSDGTTRELPVPSRKISARLVFEHVGVQQVEILGDGAPGPIVLVNVPVYVGIERAPEAPVPTEGSDVPDPTLTADRFEARVFELINEARRQSGAPPVAPDPELRSIALAHAMDMAKNNFVGHVSPTTGTPSDRVRRSGVVVAEIGENVGGDISPERAHAGLMGSPGHRANLLQPTFTHVGIGVAERPRRGFALTELFARRPPPEEARQTPESIIQAVQRLRAARRIRAVRVDPVLNAAAEAGLRAYLSGNPPSGQQANAAASASLRGQSRPQSCFTIAEILEPAQLAQISLLLDARVAGLGVAVRVLERAGRPVLEISLMFEGTAQTPLPC